jgi:hypothetical protein
VPPTAVPPTAVPPTAVPPTAVPPTATATVAQCTVPNFVRSPRIRFSGAQSIWSAAGFTTQVVRGTGTGDFQIRSQSLAAGSMHPCGTAAITLSN